MANKKIGVGMSGMIDEELFNKIAGFSIITFSCQKNIFMYSDRSNLRPMYPYKSHSTIDDAKKYMLKKRGIKNPKTIFSNSKL